MSAYLPGERVYPPDRHPARCWIVVRFTADGDTHPTRRTAAWLRSLPLPRRRRVLALLEALRDVLTLQEPT